MGKDDPNLKKMDEEANKAEKELKQHLNKWTATDVLVWHTKWYRTAGYKKLGKVLVDLGKKIKKHHSVYVIRLTGVPRGTGNDVYVGMTWRDPIVRFIQHKMGYKASRHVKRYGLELIPKLYEHLNPMTREQACRVEKSLAQELREKGYGVFGGH